MKAIVLVGESLEYQELSLMTLPSQWARIKVETAGLCGTDVAKIGGYTLPANHTRILGHEFIGSIVDMNGRSESVAIGDLAVCMPILPCGGCEMCLKGMDNLCVKAKAIGRTEQGAFAEYVNAPIKNLTKVPDGAFRDVYVLADPLAVCLHAVRLAGARSPGNKSLVIGDGSIGCLLAWILHKQGRDVSIKGIHLDNLHFIEGLGVHLLNAEASPRSYDEIYETVGRQQQHTLDECVKAIKPGGILVVLGVYAPGYTYPLVARDLFIKESHLIGANAYTQDEFRETVGLICGNEIELIGFLSHTFPLARFSDALEAMRHKSGITLKIVLKPEGSMIRTLIQTSEKKKEDRSMKENSTESIQSAFARTTDEIFSLEEWKRILRSGEKLRIKYGVDVTAPYLHIGHAVNLWMMRLLQDHGHKVIFLIGDFTTQIGDPTGKSKIRPVISQQEIEHNAQEFIKQAKMVLRFDDPELLEIRRNSEWFERMPTGEFLKLLSLVTHSRLVSRDMFQKRLSEQVDIYMHEMVYPILQGYDSFVLKADLTIIGSDQLFNEMMGRFFQERFGQTPQVIITTKITPGLDGVAKQSKSLDNYIGLGHSPRDKFGRTMRLPDNLILMYFEVYTSVPESELQGLTDLVQKDPLEAKKKLAAEIVKRYHGDQAAKEERTWFDQTFSRRETPADIPDVVVDVQSVPAINVVQKFFGNQKSRSEMRRLFQQGAISRNNIKITNPTEQITLSNGDVFQVGKRVWFKVRLQ